MISMAGGSYPYSTISFFLLLPARIYTMARPYWPDLGRTMVSDLDTLMQACCYLRYLRINYS